MSAGKMKGLYWVECQTCGVRFTGEMQLGLALKWVEKVRERPEEDDERLVAFNALALATCSAGRYVEAENMNRSLLEILRRVKGDGHESTLSTIANLARCLGNQGPVKAVDAVAMHRDLLLKRIRRDGFEHQDTLSTRHALAQALDVRVYFNNFSVDADGERRGLDRIGG